MSQNQKTDRGRTRQRVEFGDWQTPPALVADIVRRLKLDGVAPATIVEPTCGVGAFLQGARTAWPDARLEGWDINPTYVATAQSALATRATIREADFFDVDWPHVLSGFEEPLLVIGNPPWVTSSALGAQGGSNLPSKTNLTGLKGLDALTGKSNFDVSEWMLLRLLETLSGRDFVLAMLCKLGVARRLLAHAAKAELEVRGHLVRIDSAANFGAQVDAVLLVLQPGKPIAEVGGPVHWPVFPSLSAERATTAVGFVNGTLCSDVAAVLRTERFAGTSNPTWRSGLKHDCARVMELRKDGDRLLNKLGDRVHVEDAFVYPLLKGSDIANGRLNPTRAVVVPQRSLGEDTSWIEHLAPRTWAYLSTHAAALSARKSSIYRGQPPFAVFGVGEYTFAPYKVAIAGLYKRLRFELVRPVNDRPVVFDDTCYFLPFDSEEAAQNALDALSSPEAGDFFNARIFWDAKRPVNKAVLQQLDLEMLWAHLKGTGVRKTETLPRGED